MIDFQKIGGIKFRNGSGRNGCRSLHANFLLRPELHLMEEVMCLENWRNTVHSWVNQPGRSIEWLASTLNMSVSTLRNNLYYSQKISAELKESIDALMKPDEEKEQSRVNQVVLQSSKVLEETAKLNTDVISKALDGDGITFNEKCLLDNRISITIAQLTKLQNYLKQVA